MIGIKGIASYVPNTALDNLKSAHRFGETEAFIVNKIGALKLPRKDSNQDTSDLAVEAVRMLIDTSRGLHLGLVEVLVIITQNGDEEGLPHTSAIVQKKLSLDKSIAAFDISLGCSGYVYGLHVVKGFMESAGMKNGILVTADPYSKILNSEDKNTALLFGDAATATWLGESPSWLVGAAIYGTDGEGEEALKTSNNKLSMNGRKVFDFAAKNIPPNIISLLNKGGVEISDIDAFCIHQGSYAIVDTISRRFGEYQSKFIKDLSETGNTVSSSIPLLLEKHILHSEMSSVVICGFGVGFSWGSMLLSRNIECNNAKRGPE